MKEGVESERMGNHEHLEELESIREYDEAKASGDEAIPLEQALKEIDEKPLRSRYIDPFESVAEDDWDTLG